MTDLQMLLLASGIFVARAIPKWLSWVLGVVCFIGACFMYGRTM
jgi:hypothetical protein